MDLLGYADTVIHVCLAEKSKREIHDILRQAFVVPHKIRICPCVTDPWVRKTLGFLNAVYDNEPSHTPSGHDTNRKFPPGTSQPNCSTD
jgi:hypothetical protein